MANVFFPSCKFQKAYPGTSQKLHAYLSERFDFPIDGCCRENLQNLTESDRAICICNTCSAFCDESSKAREVISIWEFMINDHDFPFPDYAGEEITLQDCWRAYDKRAVQDAVRGLLRKMNIHVIEQSESFEKTHFCGFTLLAEQPSYYRDFAGKRFIENAPDSLFIPHTEEEKLTIMRDHCAGIPTEKVACYCVGCADGIRLGGKGPVHVMELLFPSPP